MSGFTLQHSPNNANNDLPLAHLYHVPYCAPKPPLEQYSYTAVARFFFARAYQDAYESGTAPSGFLHIVNMYNYYAPLVILFVFVFVMLLFAIRLHCQMCRRYCKHRSRRNTPKR